MSKLSKKTLSIELAKLASEVHTVDDEGNPVTKEAALAKLVWNAALGWTEKRTDDKGKETEEFHPPQSWAMQYLYERLEGKTAAAEPEETKRVGAAERVREAAVARINKLAVK